MLWLPANDDASEIDKATVLQLDVHRSAESGINSLVVHPEFQTDRQVFISYGVSSASGQIEQRLSRFITDVDSEILIIERNQTVDNTSPPDLLSDT